MTQLSSTAPSFRRAFCMSRQTAHRQAARSYLREVERVDTTGLSSFLAAEAFVGWGHKRAFLPVRILARLKGIPYVRLEDGFLRSVGLGKDGVPPHSLVVDFRGIYYDAHRPSDLEELLQGGGWETPELLAEGERVIDLLRRYRLTKYNVAPDLPPGALGLTGGKPRVLVIDQVYGDTSIPGGLATAATFTAMLQAALTENPGAEVVVKLHPDVLAGKRKGHLNEAARLDPRIRLLPLDVNPWSLFPLVDTVYTVSSQTGLEALLAGCPVICFGVPFYAGWGLTEDRLPPPRRSRRRSLAEVVTASYLLYARYADPVTGRLCSFEETVEALTKQLGSSAVRAAS